MFKRSFAGFVVCASLFATMTFAAEKVDFDRGGNADGAAASLRAGQEMPVQPQVPAERTFQLAPVRVVHAKGLVAEDMPAQLWKHFKVNGVAIPNALDLRRKLTQIEDQGACGSCWAFSLTATHRDGHKLGGKDPGRLSQEWLVDNAIEAGACQGGNFNAANNFVSHGQPLWSLCPYKNGMGRCSAVLPPAARITAWHMLGDKEKGPSVQEIEAYITSSGKPISIAVAAGAGDWEGYHGGIYNACRRGRIDHMINIVGWDNEGAAFDENGNLPPGKGIWILRNSWGKSWGEKGYMRTRMTDPAGERCNAVAEQAAYFDF